MQSCGETDRAPADACVASLDATLETPFRWLCPDCRPRKGAGPIEVVGCQGVSTRRGSPRRSQQCLFRSQTHSRAHQCAHAMVASDAVDLVATPASGGSTNGAGANEDRLTVCLSRPNGRHATRLQIVPAHAL